MSTDVSLDHGTAYLSDFYSMASYQARRGLFNSTLTLENTDRKHFSRKREQPDIFPELDQPHRRLLRVFHPDTGDALFRVARRFPEEDDLPMLCSNGAKRPQQGALATVPDIATFRARFMDIFAEGTLRDMDWSNVIAAGGAVVGCLREVPEEHTTSKSKIRAYFRDQELSAGDIDLFLYGLTEEQANAKLVQIYESLCGTTPYKVVCFRSAHAVTMVSQYPYRHVQVILRIYSTPYEVLAGFDVDACTFAFDGQEVWTTTRGHHSFVTGYNTIDMSRRSPSYEMRLAKYGTRGFPVALPLYTPDKVDPSVFERPWNLLAGLSKLIVLDKLRTTSDRAQYHALQKVLRGGPAKSLGERDWRDVEQVEARGGSAEASDYSTVFLPWGEGHNADRTMRLMRKKDVSLNGRWFARDREFNLHPCFFGTAEEILEDRAPHDPPVPDGIDEELLKPYVRGPLKWLQDDPGRQEIGSFNPITNEDWEQGAYFMLSTWELCKAVNSNDEQEIRRILSRGRPRGPEPIEVNRRDFVGRTPVHIAIMCGSKQALRYVCDMGGANPTHRMPDGRNAFHLCAQYNRPDCAPVVLHASEIWLADDSESTDDEAEPRPAFTFQDMVNAVDYEGKYTPLHYALMLGHVEMATFLVTRAGANAAIEAATFRGENKVNPLLLIPESLENDKMMTLVRFLRDNGATAEELLISENFNTVLHSCAQWGMPRLMRCIVDTVSAAKMLTFMNFDHQLPIECALKEFHLDCAEILADASRKHLDPPRVVLYPDTSVCENTRKLANRIPTEKMSSSCSHSVRMLQDLDESTITSPLATAVRDAVNFAEASAGTSVVGAVSQHSGASSPMFAFNSPRRPRTDEECDSERALEKFTLCLEVIRFLVSNDINVDRREKRRILTAHQADPFSKKPFPDEMSCVEFVVQYRRMVLSCGDYSLRSEQASTLLETFMSSLPQNSYEHTIARCVVGHRLASLESVPPLAALEDGKARILGKTDEILEALRPAEYSAPTDGTANPLSTNLDQDAYLEDLRRSLFSSFLLAQPGRYHWTKSLLPASTQSVALDAFRAAFSGNTDALARVLAASTAVPLCSVVDALGNSLLGYAVCNASVPTVTLVMDKCREQYEPPADPTKDRVGPDRIDNYDLLNSEDRSEPHESAGDSERYDSYGDGGGGEDDMHYLRDAMVLDQEQSGKSRLNVAGLLQLDLVIPFELMARVVSSDVAERLRRERNDEWEHEIDTQVLLLNSVSLAVCAGHADIVRLLLTLYRENEGSALDSSYHNLLKQNNITTAAVALDVVEVLQSITECVGGGIDWMFGAMLLGVPLPKDFSVKRASSDSRRAYKGIKETVLKPESLSFMARQSSSVTSTPTLLELAAFYGSRRIFDWLLGSGPASAFDSFLQDHSRLDLASSIRRMVLSVKNEARRPEAEMDWGSDGALLARVFIRDGLTSRNSRGENLVHIALQSDQVDIISAMIASNASLVNEPCVKVEPGKDSVQRAMSIPPVISAVSSSALNCLRLLLSRGAEVSATESENGFNIMHKAISECKPNVVRDLVDVVKDLCGEDKIIGLMRSPDAEGVTPLMSACCTFKTDVLMEIFRDFLNIATATATDSLGQTAFHQVLRSSRIDNFNAMLELCASEERNRWLFREDNRGQTPVDLAIKSHLRRAVLAEQGEESGVDNLVREVVMLTLKQPQPRSLIKVAAVRKYVLERLKTIGQSPPHYKGYEHGYNQKRDASFKAPSIQELLRCSPPHSARVHVLGYCLPDPQGQ